MNIEEVEYKLLQLANQQHAEPDDEFAYMYEIEGYDLILKYFIENSISLGSYDLHGLYSRDEDYEENRADLLADIQLDVLSDSPSFNVHPDVLRLYTYHKKIFWPNMEE